MSDSRDAHGPDQSRDLHLLREFEMGMHSPNDLRELSGLPRIDVRGMDDHYVLAHLNPVRV